MPERSRSPSSVRDAPDEPRPAQAGVLTIPLHERVEVRASAIHGLGVFARLPIACDTRIGAYDGEQTSANDTYVLWVEYDDGEVVGIDGQNELRYLNHSSTPNAHFHGNELYALCDIPVGAEITFDYGEDWAEVE